MNLSEKLKQFNPNKPFVFDEEAHREFTDLEELVSINGLGETYVVHAMFINKKSKFGDSPNITLENVIVNFPSHLTDTVNEMMADDELVDFVNDRMLGFEIYEYTNKYGKAYSVRWVEVPTEK